MKSLQSLKCRIRLNKSLFFIRSAHLHSRLLYDPKNDYYTVLNLDHFSEEKLKSNYLELAKKHHPDKGGDSEKFKLISNAYEVLKCKEEREIYDQLKSEHLQTTEKLKDKVEMNSKGTRKKTHYEKDYEAEEDNPFARYSRTYRNNKHYRTNSRNEDFYKEHENQKESGNERYYNSYSYWRRKYEEKEEEASNGEEKWEKEYQRYQKYYEKFREEVFKSGSNSSFEKFKINRKYTKTEVKYETYKPEVSSIHHPQNRKENFVAEMSKSAVKNKIKAIEKKRLDPFMLKNKMSSDTEYDDLIEKEKVLNDSDTIGKRYLLREYWKVSSLKTKHFIVLAGLVFFANIHYLYKE